MDRAASGRHGHHGADRDRMDLDGMLSVAERCRHAAFVPKVEVVGSDEGRLSTTSRGSEIAGVEREVAHPRKQTAILCIPLGRVWVLLGRKRCRFLSRDTCWLYDIRDWMINPSDIPSCCFSSPE